MAYIGIPTECPICKRQVNVSEVVCIRKEKLVLPPGGDIEEKYVQRIFTCSKCNFRGYWSPKEKA